MRFPVSDEEKKRIEKVSPWLDYHAQIREDAPQEIKDLHKKMIEDAKKIKKLAYS